VTVDSDRVRIRTYSRAYHPSMADGADARDRVVRCLDTVKTHGRTWFLPNASSRSSGSIWTDYSALHAAYVPNRSELRLARDHPAADSGLVRFSDPASMPCLSADRGTLRRGPSQLDQDPWFRRKRLLVAMAPPRIGKALELIHEGPKPLRPQRVRPCGARPLRFSASFTDPSASHCTVSRRLDEAALILEASDYAIARAASRVAHETTTRFPKYSNTTSRVFLSRAYRARKGTSGGSLRGGEGCRG
jgi:hypothetical protein